MTATDVLRGWEWTKDFISDELQLSHAMLHVHVGLALFGLLTLILRRPAGSPLPLLLVLLAETGNELMDFFRYYLGNWPWTVAPTVHDVVETLFWPSVLTLVARLRRTRPPVEPVAVMGSPDAPGPLAAAAAPPPPPRSADDR